MAIVRSHVVRGVLAVVALFLAFATAAAPLPPLDANSAELNKPLGPFRITDEIYFVGTRDLGIYFISTGEGAILIDGGFQQTVPQILANVRALGFDPKAIRILLNSHAHSDHAGGLLALKRLTGARLIATRADAIELARGGHGDPNFADRFLFPAVQADSLIKDGDTVTLRHVTLTAHATPGHTRGCTTWTMRTHIAGKAYDALFLCSVTAPGYRIVGNKAYPQIASDYEHSFQVLKTLPCEVFLGSHGVFYDLLRKREALLAGARTAFVDPAGCRRHIEAQEKTFRTMLTEQSH